MARRFPRGNEIPAILSGDEITLGSNVKYEWTKQRPLKGIRIIHSGGNFCQEGFGGGFYPRELWLQPSRPTPDDTISRCPVLAGTGAAAGDSSKRAPFGV